MLSPGGALSRSLKLDAGSPGVLEKEAPTSLAPAVESGKQCPAAVGYGAQPPPKLNPENLPSSPQHASQSSNPSAVDCEISADTPEPDGLAPSRT